MLFESLLNWPASNLFPVIDLLRLFVLLPSSTPHILTSTQQPLLPRLLSLLTTCQANTTDKPSAAAVLMLLRCIANLASKRDLRAYVATSASPLLDSLNTPLDSGPTGARFSRKHRPDEPHFTPRTWWRPPPEVALQSDAWTLQALSLIQFALTGVAAISTPTEEESLHRLLTALASLLTISPTISKIAKATAADLDLLNALEGLVLPEGASPLVVAVKGRCIAALKK